MEANSDSRPLSRAEILGFLRNSRRCPMCSCSECVREESDKDGRFFLEYRCGHRVYFGEELAKEKP